MFLTKDAEHIGSPEDPFEAERIEWVPLADIPALVSRDEISSGSTLAVLLYLLARQPSAT
jgi:hypothetical protein